MTGEDDGVVRIWYDEEGRGVVDCPGEWVKEHQNCRRRAVY
jgi:hypothetical protein